jgi:hypothetical protein
MAIPEKACSAKTFKKGFKGFGLSNLRDLRDIIEFLFKF